MMQTNYKKWLTETKRTQGNKPKTTKHVCNKQIMKECLQPTSVKT